MKKLFCKQAPQQQSTVKENFVFSVDVAAEKRNDELPSHIAALAEKASKCLVKKQAIEVKNLLQKHSDTFADPNGVVGSTDLVTHSIDTGNSRPVKVPYQPPAFARRQVIEENIEKMLADDVIEPSTSPWSSPVFLVKK